MMIGVMLLKYINDDSYHGRRGDGAPTAACTHAPFLTLIN